MKDRLQAKPSPSGSRYSHRRRAKHSVEHQSSAALLVDQHHKAPDTERAILGAVLSLSAVLITALLIMRILAPNLFQR